MCCGCEARLLGDSSGSVGRAFGGGWVTVGLWGALLKRSAWVLVLLAWAVDGNLDGDLTTLNLLAVHLFASLLLQFLGGEGDESEATALARLVAGLELANHEARDWAKGDLGGGWVVLGEDLKKLRMD